MDYRELIERLNAYSAEHQCHKGITAEAADAIENLLAERDAAVEDLHRMHTLCTEIGGCCPECGGQIDELMDGACDFCRGPGVACWKAVSPEDKVTCASFEWRGLQKGGANDGKA